MQYSVQICICLTQKIFYKLALSISVPPLIWILDDTDSKMAARLFAKQQKLLKGRNSILQFWGSRF